MRSRLLVLPLLLLVLLLCLPSGSLLGQEAPAESPTPAAPQRFVVALHTPGEAWKADLPPMRQPGIGDHVAFLQQLAREGVLREAGPFLDGSGGMAILRGIDLEAARRRMNADPAVKAGLLEVELRPWLVATTGADEPAAAGSSEKGEAPESTEEREDSE